MIFRRIHITLISLFISLVAYTQNNDSLLVIQRIAEAEQLINNNKNDIALKKISEAYKLANVNFWVEYKAECSYLYGKIYANEGKFQQSLEQHIKALQLFETTQQVEKQTKAQLSIAELYVKAKHYTKAIEFYELVKKHRERRKEELSLSFKELLATLYMYTGEYDKAQEYLAQVIGAKSENEKAEYYIWSAKIHQLTNKIKDGIKIIDIAEKHARKSNNDAALVETLNAKAFLYKRNGDLTTAETSLKQALTLLDSSAIDKPIKAILYTNIGVTYTNLGGYAKAKENYTKALNYWEFRNNKTKEAQALNFIAANYYLNGNRDKARITVEKALRLGKSIPAYRELAESYEILEKVAQSEIEAKRYKQLKKMAEQDANSLQNPETERLTQEIAIEAIETEIQKRIARQLDTDRKLQKLAIEAENRKRDIAIKANELTLLKREKEIRIIELQNKELERQRAAQQLEATKATAMANEFKRQEQIQRLLVSKQEADKKERDQEIKLLQNEKSLQDLQLKEEANIRKYGALALILILITLIIVIFSLRMARKSSKRLRSKNVQIESQRMKLKDAHDEIMTQNEELTQMNEEVLAQRDELEKQKEQIESKNSELNAINDDLHDKHKKLDMQHKQISASIRYARTIQSAILPNQRAIGTILQDNFILYRPKDVVSGDFYWMDLVTSSSDYSYKTFVAVVDCTGHGVPGAFMSLIGSRLLNEIVDEKGITNPKEILEMLDIGIRTSLRQSQTENRDGMDVALCCLEKGENNKTRVTFSGAKRPLIYWEQASDSIQIVKGGRRSIGGAKYNSITEFSNVELELDKGDIIYLTSDGYMDQNGDKAKRIGTPLFLDLLNKVKTKPLPEQCDYLNHYLDDHQGKKEQRDDITIWGVRV